MFETGATNAAVNDIVLTVINDGNGDACGFSYERPPKPQAVWNATPDACTRMNGAKCTAQPCGWIPPY